MRHCTKTDFGYGGGTAMKIKYIILGLVLFSLTYPRNAVALSEKENKFGFYTDRMFVLNRTIVFNDALNKKINTIGNKVAEALGVQDIKYTFRVVNDPVINAYSAAGGFIYINTGLLDVLESEDELAAVMAHEIVHTSKNHQIDFVYAAHRRAVAGQVAGIVIGTALGIGLGKTVPQSTPTYGYPSYDLTRQMMDLGFKFGEAMGNAMTASMIEGYGKDLELEADALAVQYTEKAGYDPNALVSFFKRLKSIRDRLSIKKDNYTSSLINADPGLEERIKNAEELITKTK